MFYQYHPVVKMPLSNVQIWAYPNKYMPRSKTPWITCSWARILLLSFLVLVMLYYSGRGGPPAARAKHVVPQAQDVRLMRMEEEEAEEDEWRLQRPVNLSLEETSPDFATVDRITKLAKEDHSIECVHTSLMEHLGFSVCVYEDDPEEEAISRQLKKGTFFEHDSVIAVLTHLLDHDGLGLIDVGANLGIYSLAAARMGRPVVAVEPIRDNQKRLVKAANINHESDKIILIPNAISDSRLALRLKIPNKNKGRSYLTSNHYECVSDDSYTCSHLVPTMVLDELLPYIPFREALLRMDTHGHSMEAIARSKVFFREIHVPLICVSWYYYREKWYQGAKERQKVTNLIAAIIQMDYLPCDSQETELDVETWRKWPDHVYWISMLKK